MLTFDAATHRYFRDGIRIPGVTQVLEPLFDWSRVPQTTLERKRRIGVAVHVAIHLDMTHGVDLDTIHPACRPYFAAYSRFRRECQFEPILVEHRVYNDQLDYAGTLDVWGKLQGKQCLLDWKCSMLLQEQAVGAQTAAYLAALVRSGIGSIKDDRYALKLGADGRYKLTQYRALYEDMQRFVRYLNQPRAAA